MNHKKYNKVVLVVLDGFGIASYGRGNAIGLANPEIFNYIVANFPTLTLQASGPLVGLPWGEMGNSEVGHLNIGAGRIVGQDLPRITASIQNGEFFKNEAFLKAVEHVKQNNSSLHLIGMVSPGGVHSLDEHLYALLGLAKEQGLTQAYIHMFTDGRDTGQKVALETLQKTRKKIMEIGLGTIATIAGRFYAMDRGEHWDQTHLTYESMVSGVGETATSAEEAVLTNYHNNVYDEMIKPTVIVEPDEAGNMHPVATIKDNDAIIFFNFRQDRALQLTRAFVQPNDIPTPDSRPALQNLCFVTMTEYMVNLPVTVAFPTINLANNLAEVISKSGLKQFHIAESEKYAHVTSFFNCGSGEPFPGEERLIVTSPTNSKNYVDQPQMSAPELTRALVEKITKTDINFFVANYANGDMVGHTGNIEACINAVRSLDIQMQSVMQAVLMVDGALLVTADHGNVEQLINNRTGEVDKDHTTNPVPFFLIANEFKFAKPEDMTYQSLASKIPEGVISDVAPTVLDLFGIAKPEEMTAINLLSLF